MIVFTRKEYKQRLGDIGLTKEQTEKLRTVLEEMMTLAARTGNGVYWEEHEDENGKREKRQRSLRLHPLTEAEERLHSYFEGKTDGLNAVDRFLRGDMDAHDEFDKE